MIKFVYYDYIKDTVYNYCYFKQPYRFEYILGYFEKYRYINRNYVINDNSCTFIMNCKNDYRLNKYLICG